MTTAKRYTELSVIILILLISSIAGCTSPYKSTPKDTPNTKISVKTAYTLIENYDTDISNLTFYLNWTLVDIAGYPCSIKDANIGECDSWLFKYNAIIILNNSYKEVENWKSILLKKTVPTYSSHQYSANYIPIQNLTKIRSHFLNISIDLDSFNDSNWAGLRALYGRGNIPPTYVVNHVDIRLTANNSGQFYDVQAGLGDLYFLQGRATWVFKWDLQCKGGGPMSEPCSHHDKVIVDAKTGHYVKIQSK
jgi:hypothetical protein